MRRHTLATDCRNSLPAVKPVTIRLPSPSHAQTLPPLPNATATSKSSKSVPTYPSTLTIHPQPSETIQDIRATIAEWPGGYWLGPYSLRLSGEGIREGAETLLSVAKEGLEIRAGEKLSDWLEVGEVFSHLEKSDEEQDGEKIENKEVEDASKEPERVLIVQPGE
jgi:protein TIF31